MNLPLSTTDWQVLRFALRSGTATGRELRIWPSRRTKDGTFLQEFVDKGLLRVVTPNDDPFKATYAITPEGEYAAEHGEYECEMRTYKAVPLKSTPEERLKDKIAGLVKAGVIRQVKKTTDPLQATYAFVAPEPVQVQTGDIPVVAGTPVTEEKKDKAKPKKARSA